MVILITGTYWDKDTTSGPVTGIHIEFKNLLKMMSEKCCNTKNNNKHNNWVQRLSNLEILVLV